MTFCRSISFVFWWEILRDKFQALIESWADAGIAYEDEEFSGNVAGAEESRTKANYMIRRMKEFGWLDYEQRENFKIFILLPHYSSRWTAPRCADKKITPLL